jgi:tetratricopeptide (TPR) repeat protein
MEGRPDGQRPFGRESLLEHYQEERDTYRSENGSDTGFQLDHEACGLLGQEGLQYYHRYVCLFRLEAYEEVERDTARNLRLFDFVHQYAADEEDRTSMEQYRPYVIMMNTRAKGALHVNRKDYDAALRQIEAGVERIRSFLQETGQVEEIETSNEIGFLRQWEEEVRKSRPLTLKQRLQQQLQEAIAREEFERAAEIRDQVRKLEQHNL